MKRHMRKVVAGAAAGACAAGVACSLSGCVPAEETPEGVYGPPTDFGSAEYDPSSEIPEVVYGPPPEFDPDANMNEDVYGPPEMFDGNSDEAPADGAAADKS